MALWNLILKYNPKFQYSASSGHDPYTCNYQGQSVQKIKVETDMQMIGTNRLTMPAM